MPIHEFGLPLTHFKWALVGELGFACFEGPFSFRFVLVIFWTLTYIYIYILVDNHRNIINENRKEKYKLLMMINNKKKRIKQVTKKKEIRKII